MTVTAILRKDQPDKDNLCRIYIRVNKGNKRHYYSTEIKLKSNQFDKKVKNHPQADKLNREIRNIIYAYEQGVIKEPATFSTFVDEMIKEARENKWRNESTLRIYSSQKDKFVRFAGDVLLGEISHDLLKRYNTWMIKKGNSNNTVWSSFKFLKTVLKKAGIKIDFPSVPYKQTSRTYLSSDEVKKIEKHETFKDEAKLFLLQCYTGVRFADLKTLYLNKEKSFDENRIVLSTNKTGEIVSMPLLPEVKKLLKKNINIPTLEDYNRKLKLIASAEKIKKNLSSHVARHTFAVRLAELKVSKEVAGKLLGHRKASTTDIYYKIQNARVDEEFKGFSY